METLRKKYQGIYNIVRFNWHYYLLSFPIIIGLIVLSCYTSKTYSTPILLLAILAAAGTIISLLVSFYIYDYSGLYHFSWINTFTGKYPTRILNIHSGFDETSSILNRKFPESELLVADFYDPAKHREVSIKRARMAYPAYQGTVSVTTNNIPFAPCSVDIVFAIFSAHEIRDRQERIDFLIQLKNLLTPEGIIVIVEHLRDIPNFLAYNIGCMHFHSRKTWLSDFEQAGLKRKEENKLNLFVRYFILK